MESEWKYDCNTVAIPHTDCQGSLQYYPTLYNFKTMLTFTRPL